MNGNANNSANSNVPTTTNNQNGEHSDNTRNSDRGRNNDNNSDGDSDSEDTAADLQLGELEERANETKWEQEWGFDNAYNMFKAILQVLPREAIVGLRNIAEDNVESVRHAWLHNCIREMEPSNYSESVRHRTNSNETGTNGSGTLLVSNQQPYSTK